MFCVDKWSFQCASVAVVWTLLFDNNWPLSATITQLGTNLESGFLNQLIKQWLSSVLMGPSKRFDRLRSAFYQKPPNFVCL